MEESNNVCISINVRDGSVTITGPESFVEKNIETALSFIERNMVSSKGVMSGAASDTFKGDNQSPPAPVAPNEQKTLSDDKYVQLGIYHIDSEDGSISILKKVPGKNKAEKAKNIALIVSYIRKGKVEGKELIPICEKHACYDSSNFASYFKNEMTNFVRKGSGQSWTIELTQPGETAALALLEEMANDK